MARVSIIHRVIWQPPSVTDVADDGARLPESMLDSESSDATDDIVELEKYGGRIIARERMRGPCTT